MIRNTYKSQSTDIISPILSVGAPTASNTIINVTRPADGIPAAPIDAAVAVMLSKKVKFQ